MDLNEEQFKQSVIEAKKRLRQSIGNHQESFKQLHRFLEAEIENITLQAQNAIPQFDFSQLKKQGGFDNEQKEGVHRAGCLVVRNVLDSDETSEHYQQLVEYIESNGYYEHAGRVKDNYFAQLDAQKPQIFGLYWSKAQIWARHHPNMALLRSQLNRLWRFQGKDNSLFFNPDQELAYADRVRRRRAGDKTLGLSPHVDAGSVERWIGKNYSTVYRKIFSPQWQTYQAFDGAYRVSSESFASAAVASVFRTFQGWVAATAQGKGDGTLQLVPSSWALPYMLLRALQDDIAEDSLCGALPGRALLVDPQYHELLFKGLISIPRLEPGDTIWWHPDTIHAVENEHNGKDYSSVLFIGAVPDCAKNRDYLKLQKEAFLRGKSAPDFAPEDYEVNYHDRATLEDLGEIGLQQMGFSKEHAVS